MTPAPNFLAFMLGQLLCAFLFKIFWNSIVEDIRPRKIRRITFVNALFGLELIRLAYIYATMTHA